MLATQFMAAFSSPGVALPSPSAEEQAEARYRASAAEHSDNCFCLACFRQRFADPPKVEPQRPNAPRAMSQCGEARHRANRRRVARELARTMREADITACNARIAGLGAVTREQIAAQTAAREAVANKAGCREGYIPKDATWEMACDLLEAGDA